VFQQDAVQLVARKVASLSGDARRALDICRRATELAEGAGKASIGLKHVTAAYQEMFTSPKVQAIRWVISLRLIDPVHLFLDHHTVHAQ
jgi:origin recognition complex subunit 1